MQYNMQYLVYYYYIYVTLIYSLITSNGSTVTSCRTQRKRKESGQRKCYNVLLTQMKCTVR